MYVCKCMCDTNRCSCRRCRRGRPSAPCPPPPPFSALCSGDCVVSARLVRVCYLSKGMTPSFGRRPLGPLEPAVYYCIADEEPMIETRAANRSNNTPRPLAFSPGQQALMRLPAPLPSRESELVRSKCGRIDRFPISSSTTETVSTERSTSTSPLHTYRMPKNTALQSLLLAAAALVLLFVSPPALGFLVAHPAAGAAGLSKARRPPSVQGTYT